MSRNGKSLLLTSLAAATLVAALFGLRAPDHRRRGRGSRW